MVNIYHAEGGGEVELFTHGTELTVDFVDDWDDAWVMFEISLSEDHSGEMKMDAALMEPSEIRELVTELEEAAEMIEEVRSD